MSDQDEPLDHVARFRPPWVDTVVTECGRPADKVAGEVLSWQEYVRKLKRLGQQRTAMTTCMTCHSMNMSVRVADRETMALVDNWDENPVGVVLRWFGIGGYHQRSKDHQVQQDLRAIGQLIERHREEFEQLRQPDELGQRRREAAKEARRQAAVARRRR